MSLWVGIPARAWVSAAVLIALTGALALVVSLAFGSTGINIAALALLQITAVLALAGIAVPNGVHEFTGDETLADDSVVPMTPLTLRVLAAPALDGAGGSLLTTGRFSAKNNEPKTQSVTSQRTVR